MAALDACGRGEPAPNGPNGHQTSMGNGSMNTSFWNVDKYGMMGELLFAILADVLSSTKNMPSFMQFESSKVRPMENGNI